MKRRGLDRLSNDELAIMASSLLACVDGWNPGDNDNQTADELRISRAYDSIFDEGERRLGSTEFANLRDSKKMPDNLGG